ncbi:MAG: TolC family protein [Bacteroidota bacterium]
MNRLLILFGVLAFWWVPQASFSQGNDQSAQDSLSILGPQTYFDFVVQNHPVAQQAELLNDQARSTLRMARGGFDPKLEASFDDKFFKSTNYFNVFSGGLKVPTWYGIEAKAGYDYVDGSFSNPMDFLPDNGLVTAGLSVSVLQGLVIDERRATLQQAKILQSAANVDRVIALNNLLLSAMGTYWQWARSYMELQVFERAVDISEVRFEAVKASFFAGDEPGIDTLEALIQLQNRQLSRNDALLEFIKKGLEVSNFLWDEDGRPLEITQQLRPVRLGRMPIVNLVTQDSVNMLINNLSRVHPELLSYRYEIATLDVERRLKAEKLKPKLNVNYNVIAEATTSSTSSELLGIEQGVLPNNYKWGFEFSFPLFLRKERGNLQLTRIKLQQTNLKRDQKQLELTNKIQASYNEILIVLQQIELYSQTVSNYQRLLRAEEIKFDLGESSLFLINSREQKLIEAQQKLVSLQSKYFAAQAGLAWISGLLFNDL